LQAPSIVDVDEVITQENPTLSPEQPKRAI
jgi:hypothetical protein